MRVPVAEIRQDVLPGVDEQRVVANERSCEFLDHWIFAGCFDESLPVSQLSVSLCYDYRLALFAIARFG